MLILQLELWLVATNTYVVAPEAGGPAVIIDAPPECFEPLTDLLATHDLTPTALLVTHGHVDHLGGAADLVARTGVAAYLHPEDDFLARRPEDQLRVLMGTVPPGDYRPPETYRELSDGQVLDLAGLRLGVVATPGHTPGHCCFYLAEEGVFFSGDHLLAGSIGRTDLPGADQQTLMTSMRDKILPLDDGVTVMPGHGPSTTVGRERRSNPFLIGL